MQNSAFWEKFFFQEFFASINKIFILGEGLGTMPCFL